MVDQTLKVYEIGIAGASFQPHVPIQTVEQQRDWNPQQCHQRYGAHATEGSWRQEQQRESNEQVRHSRLDVKDHVNEPEAIHEFHGKVLKPNSQGQDQNVSKAEEHDSKVGSEAVKNLHVEIPLESNVGRGEYWDLDFDEWNCDHVVIEYSQEDQCNNDWPILVLERQ